MAPNVSDQNSRPEASANADLCEELPKEGGIECVERVPFTRHIACLTRQVIVQNYCLRAVTRARNVRGQCSLPQLLLQLREHQTTQLAEHRAERPVMATERPIDERQH